MANQGQMGFGKQVLQRLLGTRKSGSNRAIPLVARIRPSRGLRFVSCGSERPAIRQTLAPEMRGPASRLAAAPLTQAFFGNAVKPPYFGAWLSPTRLVMRPTSAPIITPPEGGCQECAATKAPDRELRQGWMFCQAGRPATRVPAFLFLRSRKAHQHQRPLDCRLPILREHDVQRSSGKMRRFATLCKSSGGSAEP
jgi:hypothetical protein